MAGSEMDRDIMSDARSGTIVGFEGNMSSGIGLLQVRDDDGVTRLIPCDNAPTVRALDSMFNCVRGHTLMVDRIIGERIMYGMDEMGSVLGWIAADSDIIAEPMKGVDR